MENENIIYQRETKEPAQGIQFFKSLLILLIFIGILLILIGITYEWDYRIILKVVGGIFIISGLFASIERKHYEEQCYEAPND